MRLFSRKTLVVLLILVCVLAALAGAALWFVNDQLSRLPQLVVQALEKASSNRAEVGSAEFVWPATVVVRDARITGTNGETIATIKRLSARCSLTELLGARLRLESLVLDDVEVSVHLNDLKPSKKSPRALPDHPIQVSRLALILREGEGDQARPWLTLSDVAITLQPQTTGCLRLEASGDSSALGRFRSSGVLGGNVLDSRLDVSFPHVPLGGGVREILPLPVRAVWDRLGPKGDAVLRAELAWPKKRSEQASRVDLGWWVSVNDATVQVPDLADPVRHVSATIEGTADSVTVTEATGSYRSALLTCSAHTVRRGGLPGMRLRAKLRDLEPTPECLALLPRHVKKAVDRQGLRDGLIDADVDLLLPLPEDGDFRRSNPDFFRADIRLRDCSARPVWFPYRLDKLGGAFSIAVDGMVITSPLVGWHGDGSIQLTGTIGFTRKRPQSEVMVQIDDIDMDRDLKAALGTFGNGVPAMLKRYALEDGKLDALLYAKGQFGLAGKTPEPEWSLRLGFDGCSAVYAGFPYSLRGLTGRVDLRPGKVSFKDLTAWHGDSTVRISGWADTRRGHDELNLEVRGTNVRLDDDLKTAVPDGMRRRWDELRLAGLADLDIVITTPTRTGKPFDLRVNALFKHCSGRLPVGGQWISLTDIGGRVQWAGDVCRFSGLSAKCLDGMMTADGVLIQSGTLTKMKGDLGGRNLSVSKLISVLPEKAAAEVRGLRPSGRITLRKCDIDLTQAGDAPPRIQYTAELDLHDGAVTLPLFSAGGQAAQQATPTLSEINGRVRVENRQGRIGTVSFELDKARLLKGTLSNVVGRIKRTSPMFFAGDVRADLYGGAVEGSFKAATDLLFFSARASASGVDVARLNRETEITRDTIWGDLSATVQLDGSREPGDRPTWELSGSGSLDIGRANLGETALVKSMVNLRNLFGSANRSVITAAEANFEIDSQKFRVHRILLSGVTGSARGVGSIGHGGDYPVDLYFYSKAKGSLLPDLILLDQIGKGLNRAVELLQNRIVVVRVAGTLKTPKVSPAVLKDLREDLQGLIVDSARQAQEETTRPDSGADYVPNN